MFFECVLLRLNKLGLEGSEYFEGVIKSFQYPGAQYLSSPRLPSQYDSCINNIHVIALLYIISERRIQLVQLYVYVKLCSYWQIACFIQQNTSNHTRIFFSDKTNSELLIQHPIKSDCQGSLRSVFILFSFQHYLFQETLSMKTVKINYFSKQPKNYL